MRGKNFSELTIIWNTLSEISVNQDSAYYVKSFKTKIDLTMVAKSIKGRLCMRQSKPSFLVVP